MNGPENSGTTRLVGTPLSRGLVIGTAYQVETFAPAFYRIRVAEEDVEREVRRFETAVEECRRQLKSLRRRVESLVGKEQSYLVDVHLLILEDRRFLDEIVQAIRQRLASPERAVRETAEKWLSVFKSLDDPFFRERGSELKDVEERILANLIEVNGQDNQHLPENLILVAPHVNLSVLAQYRLERIKGLVLTKAGRASHVTIIARSYQIPVVSGIEHIVEQIRTGDTVIVDGYKGVVICNPGEDEIRCHHLRAEEEQRRLTTLDSDQRPCMTRDARRVFLYINTETESEVLAGLRQGAEGVGLSRSEFIFMKKQTALMTEEEQYEAYRSLVEAAGDKPVILRTLDFAEGRPPFSLVENQKESGSLGLRGIRLSLKYPEVFRAQLRAILRAGRHGNLKLVFPMVSGVDEIIAGRKMIEAVQSELEAEGLQASERLETGVMLEVPAAILTLENIFDYADFAAVGTNDLIQYTLAASRANDRVAYLFNPLHPAVLASLKRIADVSLERGRTTYICGEIASNPVYAYVLIGLGFQHLSMHPSNVSRVKEAVRRMDYEEARLCTRRILSLPTMEAVDRFVAENLGGIGIENTPGASR